MEKIVPANEFLKLIQENQQVSAPDLQNRLFHAEIAALIEHEWFTYDLRNISIRDGLQLNISKVVSHTDYALEMPMLYDLLGITYGLKGFTSMCFQNKQIDLPTGNSIVYRFSSEDQKAMKKYEKGEDIHFSIHFTIDTFKSMLDLPEASLPEAFKSFAYGNESELYQTTPVTNDERQILKELVEIDQTGLSRQFLVESKVLELISIKVEHLAGTAGQVQVSQKDEKLQACKDLLVANFANPPSLIDLTKQVGINLFDLKVGFKKKFGLPPYQYLKNYRLDRAYDMLNDGKAVTEVADHIGYISVGSFSNAFFDKFQQRPSSV